MKPRKNILLIRFKAIGDVVLTLPAVHAVRENFPDARITFFTVSENAALLQGFRDVDEVIALDRAALKSPLRVLPEFFQLLRRLRAGKFSLVIDLQGYGETAWLTRLTGARERWGTVYGRGREWAYTRGLKRNEALHPAEWNLFLLRECGLKIGEIKNEFVLPADALVAAQKIFSEHKLDCAKPTLFLQPFTSSPHKNWALDNYLALADHWRARGVQVIIAGGPADQPLLARARSLGFAVPASRPRLADAGLMKLSTVIIGGDTGFMHLAVALGKRVVMLMNLHGSGSVVPFRHPEWVIAPKTGSPLAEVAPEKVIDAVGSALADAGIKN
ncbi:MAG TPA: glycosyltransferase family 9 protein [Candidatus Limnocylindrales bacterium]|nr:glycosyltransferase family 9 protein [Candidatus Limnocylindrales bacterium]